MAKKVLESFLGSIEIKKPPQNDAEALMIYENWLNGSVLVFRFPDNKNPAQSGMKNGTGHRDRTYDTWIMIPPLYH